MKTRSIPGGFRAIRARRLAVLLLTALAAGLASDWLRKERVVFPAPLPEFTTIPASP